MSAYVGRLIARAHGRLPVVRPRLPGRFEPASGLAADPVPISIIEQMHTAEATPHSTAAPFAAAPGSPTRPFAIGDLRLQMAPPPAVAPSSAVAAPSAAVRAQAAPPESSTELPIAADAAAIGSRRAPVRHAEIATSPALSPDAAESAPFPTAPESEPAAFTLAPPPAPRGAQPAAPVPHAARESNDTVVHVTIGRVDVRAIVAEPAKSAPRTERPRRSLADYLAQARR